MSGEPIMADVKETSPSSPPDPIGSDRSAPNADVGSQEPVTTPSPSPSPPPPPPLTAQERRVYGRLGTMMESFHNHFRYTWNTLYRSVSPDGSSPSYSSSGSSFSDSQPSPLSAKRLIDLGLSFVQQLTAHHSIEEAHLFPFLAVRMPTFRPGAFAYEQHRGIHAGLDRLEAYLGACRAGGKELRRDELRAILDSFGEVLWTHLDEEVRELGAEKMRAVYTMEEMQRMPF